MVSIRPAIADVQAYHQEMARIVSLNVGRPAPIEAANRTVITAIAKTSVQGRVRVSRLNVDGDQQADLRVHGGFDKAVYGYPSEHYPPWSEELTMPQLPFGMFGENLTTEGLDETALGIGDILRAGTVTLRVSQPRMPCFKLALRFGRSDMVKLFWRSGRSGFYLAVVEEGELAAGDAIEVIEKGRPEMTVAEVVRLYRDPMPDRERLLVALETPLAGSWKKEMRERLTTTLFPE
jgi:MOSC domain-containing protein YiiM